MRRSLFFTLCFVVLACRRSPTPVRDAAMLVEDGDEILPGAPKRNTGRCRSTGITWASAAGVGEVYDRDAGVLRIADAGDPMYPTIESAAGAFAPDGVAHLVWAVASESSVRFARGARAPLVFETGVGARGVASIGLAGTRGDVPVVTWVQDTPAGRRHVVREGAALERSCTHPERRDDAPVVALAATTSGALIAWDEDSPSGATVRVQHVPVPLVQGACGEARTITAPTHDASDPVLAAAPDGGAVLLWLDAHELTADQNNETVTEVWAVSLDAAGAPVGPPVRLTNTPGHRFAIASAVSRDGSTVWAAWRAVRESTSEARGDGGSIAIARLTRSPNGLARLGESIALGAEGRNPTGSVRVFARTDARAGAEIWWRERRDGVVLTFHRAIEANGRPAHGPDAIVEEPALAGELPEWAAPEGGSLAAIVRTPAGGVGTMRYRCEP
jgi:hypothetical protein